MERKVQTGTWLLVLAAAVPIGVQAQDKVEASVGADLVSGYIWRGQDLGNVSIQPAASIAYRGFSLSGWGSVGFDKEDTKEFDLTSGMRGKDSVYRLPIIGSMAVPVISTTEVRIQTTCSRRSWGMISGLWL